MPRAYAIRIGVLPSGLAAPTSAFAVGTQVGVPTGAGALTASAGLGTNDGTESLTITHPVTGATNTRTATVYRRRRWTSTISPAGTAAAPILFDQCHFDGSSATTLVDINENSAVNDQMRPVVVFRNCTFTGGDSSSKCLIGSYVWLLSCHLTGAEDCWAGAIYSVAQDSNLISTTSGVADPHSDAIQIAGYGQSDIFHCWTDAGRNPASANAPIRIGSEFAAVANIGIRYTGLAGVAHGLQVRGDAGAGDISGITVIGCRWVPEQLYGPTDFAETTGITWSDNAFTNGTTIPSP